MPEYSVQTKPGNPAHVQYSSGNIAWEAEKAGFKGEEVVIATAIALAESGGWIDAYNDNPITKDLSFGLWQINMYGALGPARRQQFGISDNSQLFGSAVNAKAARIIYLGQGWNAWSVYKSKVYLAHMTFARLGAANPKPSDQVSAQDQGGVITQVDLLKPFKDLLNWFLDLLKPLFLRVAGFIGGGILVIVGVILYVRSQAK